MLSLTQLISLFGQKKMTDSLPVVIASDQSAIRVTVQSPAPVIGTVTANQGTSPWVVAGTVTANAGTNLNTSALALAATQTDRTQKTQITDGTRDGTIKASSTAAVVADTSLVVGLSPNSPLPTGSNIIGALTANQSVNVSQVGGNTTSTGSGVTNSGTIRTVLPTDQTGINTFLDKNVTGSIVALNGTVGGVTNGIGVIIANVSGVWSATLIFEGSVDGGGTYFTIPFATIDGLTFGSTTTANGTFKVAVSGLSHFRLRASAFTSGSASVVINAGAGNSLYTLPTSIIGGLEAGTFRYAPVKAASTAAIATDQSLVIAFSPNSPLPTGSNTIGALTANQSVNLAQVAGTNTVTGGVSGLLAVGGNAASAATDSGNPVKTGAIFNSTLPTVTNTQRVDSQADANGRHITLAVPSDGYKATYLATSTFTAAATPTDIFTVTGSGTKTVRIIRVGISGTQTTSSAINVTLLKRSTANTGGTSTTLTNVPLDSNNAAATATVRSYTANPTTGTLVGNLRNVKTIVSIVAVGGNASAQNELVEYFGDQFGQALVLRGTNDVFSVNLNATTVTGNSFSIWVEWTEE